MPPLLQTVLLLILSNIFMTLAWYAHLTYLKGRTWLLVVMASWSIALFEYMAQVPANQIGHTQAGMEMGQLKILQEVISLTVFVPIAFLILKEPVRLNFLWAGLCLAGAVYFAFQK